MLRLTPLALILALAPNLLAAQNIRALELLSARSGIDIASLQTTLASCEFNQLSMNICAFYGAVAAELALDDVIAETKLLTPAQYEVFKSETQAACLAQAESEAGGGSMMPMLVSACVEESYRYRFDVITGLGDIEAPAHPPHKWD